MGACLAECSAIFRRLCSTCPVIMDDTAYTASKKSALRNNNTSTHIYIAHEVLSLLYVVFFLVPSPLPSPPSKTVEFLDSLLTPHRFREIQP